MAQPHVIYHANCNDGFGAAWCAWRKFNVLAQYRPMHYGGTPPDVTGQHVYILDFSFPLAAMRDLQKQAASLLVIDHHKTAREDLAPLVAEGLAEFDMARSGATMAWRYFFPNAPRPWFLDYIEDRDLWRHALPRTRELNAVINLWPHDFTFWDAMYEANDMESAIEDGAAICRYIDYYVKSVSSQARLIDFAGYRNVPCVNAPGVAISELLHELARGSTFALGWFQRGDGKYQYSLRSVGDFDVSEVARQFGGGGHRNAAGFVTDARVD